MGFAEYLILFTLIFSAADLCFLAVYCRVQKKLDRRRITNVKTDRAPQTTPSEPQKQNPLKALYAVLNPYLYGWMRYSTVMVGKIPSQFLRNRILRHVFCMEITKRTVINGGCEIRSPWNIRADRCIIGNNGILDGRNGIVFGQDVVLGNGVHIWTEEHNIDDSLFRVLPENRLPVKIGNRAWICSDSTILAGVTVGEGAVLASRACLTKDADAFGVYGGIPAKKLRERNRELIYELNGKPTWHFY